MGAGSQLEDLFDHLPTLPDVPLQILRLIDDPNEHSLQEIGELASRDPVVASRLFRMANSALLGPAAWIADTATAVQRLGLVETRKLVLTVALIQTFDKESYGFDIRRFWTFSLASALCAEQIARQLREPRSDSAYLAALVHRIGDIALALFRPVRFSEAIHHAQHRGGSWDEGIQKSFQVEAPRLCAQMLRRWNFPPPVIEAVENQSDPAAAGPHADLAWIVFIADRLCRLLGIGFESHPPDGLDWIEKIPCERFRTLFPADAGALIGYIAEHWGALQQTEMLVNDLFDPIR